MDRLYQAINESIIKQIIGVGMLCVFNVIQKGLCLISRIYP